MSWDPGVPFSRLRPRPGVCAGEQGAPEVPPGLALAPLCRDWPGAPRCPGAEAAQTQGPGRCVPPPPHRASDSSAGLAPALALTRALGNPLGILTWTQAWEVRGAREGPGGVCRGELGVPECCPGKEEPPRVRGTCESGCLRAGACACACVLVCHCVHKNITARAPLHVCSCVHTHVRVY